MGKPGDAVDYLKNTVGGTPEDKKTIDELRTENSELKAKLAEVEKSQSDLQSKITALESKDSQKEEEKVPEAPAEVSNSGDNEASPAPEPVQEAAPTEAKDDA